MTDNQRQVIIAPTTIATGAVGVSTGGLSGGITAGDAGYNEVVNNWLSSEEQIRYNKLVAECNKNISRGNPACAEAYAMSKTSSDRDLRLAETINILLASGDRLGKSTVTEDEAEAWNHINWAVQYLCPKGQCSNPDYKALYQLSQMTPYQFDQFLAESHPEDYILGTAGLLKAGLKGFAVYFMERTMFKSATIPLDLATKYALNATKNPKATEVVLGRFESGINATSYEQVAQSRGATYFDMDNWGVVSQAVNGNKDEIWKINRSFLEQQVSQGKSFVLTSNPDLATKGTYLFREIDFLKQVGYTKVTYQNGVWNVAKP